MNYRFNTIPLQNLLTNSGFGVWSNSTISNVSPPVYAGVTNGVCGRDSSSGVTIHSITTGCLVRYGGTSVFEVTAIAGGTTFTLHDTSFSESGVSFYRFVPACVAGDSLGPDGWYKESSLDIYREEENSDYNNTKDGSFYALKGVTAGGADWLRYPLSAIRAKREWYKKFAGRTITLGCWAKTSTASCARLSIYDGTTINGAYHSGGGSWEWLELTTTVSSSVLDLLFDLRFNAAGTVYYSQLMLVFGPSIGEGNYVQPSEETIHLETPFDLSGLAGSYSTVGAWTDINLEAQSNGRIPKGIKEISLYVQVHDSLSANNQTHIYFKGLGDYFGFGSCGGLTNDVYSTSNFTQPCNVDGDIQYKIVASGAGNFDIDRIRVASYRVT